MVSLIYKMDPEHVPLIMLPMVLGILSHVCYFRKGEHHLKSLLYLQVATLFPILAALGLSAALGIRLFVIAKYTVVTETVYLVALWVSMALYRGTSLHRLSMFPGPRSWKYSKMSQSWANRGLRSFEVLDRLHSTYGEYIRTGSVNFCKSGDL